MNRKMDREYDFISTHNWFLYRSKLTTLRRASSNGYRILSVRVLSAFPLSRANVFRATRIFPGIFIKPSPNKWTFKTVLGTCLKTDLKMFPKVNNWDLSRSCEMSLVQDFSKIIKNWKIDRMANNDIEAEWMENSNVFFIKWLWR